MYETQIKDQKSEIQVAQDLPREQQGQRNI